MKRLAFSLLCFACLSGDSHAGVSLKPEERIRVQLVPTASAVLSAEINAKVQRLPLREGDAFAAGDLLVVFESSLQEAQLQRAESLLAAAEASAAASRQLVALKSAGQLEATLAETEVRKAQAEVRFAREMLQRCSLRAPYAGQIAERRIQEFEYAQAGQALLEIISNGPLRVEFIAPSRQLEIWKVGTPLQLTLDETGLSYAAHIERIGVRIDPISQSIKVVATLDGTPTGLVAGMTGRLVSVAAPPSAP